jgi:hypothetical protein
MKELRIKKLWSTDAGGINASATLSDQDIVTRATCAERSRSKSRAVGSNRIKKRK